MISAITHHFSDNLYAKEMHVPEGMAIVQHKHKFDHLSVLAKGKAKILLDGVETVYDAPACINIVKNKNHGVIALTDVIWYCVHSTSETNIDKIDEVLIRVNSPEKVT